MDSSKIGGLLLRRGRVRAEDIVRGLSLQDHEDRRCLGEILVEIGAVTEGTIRADVIEIAAAPGIDSECVNRKALDKGPISPERAARMTEHEAVNSIFLVGDVIRSEN